jgi:hypothetical protein
MESRLGDSRFVRTRCGIPVFPRQCRTRRAPLCAVLRRNRAIRIRRFAGFIPCHENPARHDRSECSEIAVRSIADRPWPAGSEIKTISVRELLTLENATSASSPCPIYPESLLNEILEDARTRLPAANPADIYMNKSRFRVVSHSATGKSQHNIAQSRRCNTWYTDIDSLGLHVVCEAINSLSSSPSRRMTCNTPISKARSVPGRSGR